jgi:hypothetical protein
MAEDFDVAFGTLDLVNASDMDVFIKVLMLVDEKESQCLRGELNHVVAKYIDRDDTLKSKLKDNIYENYNIKYVTDIYNKLRAVKIRKCHSNISYVIDKILKESSSFDYTMKIIDHYVHCLRSVNCPNLDREIRKECVLDPKYENEILYLHKCLYQIIELIDIGYVPAISMIDTVSIRGLRKKDVLAGITFVFNYESMNDYANEYNIKCQVLFMDIDKTIVHEAIQHFSKSNYIYNYANTVAYLDARKLDTLPK